MGEDAELVLCDAAETGLVQKSGNLWFGFQVSYGDYILLLDADFTRRHDPLNEALTYMDAYPTPGFVQTP